MTYRQVEDIPRQAERHIQTHRRHRQRRETYTRQTYRGRQMEDTVHLKVKVLHRYFNTYKDCKRHLQACTDIHQKTYLGTQTGIRRHTQVHRQTSEDIYKLTQTNMRRNTQVYRQISEDIPRYTDRHQKTHILQRYRLTNGRNEQHYEWNTNHTQRHRQILPNFFCSGAFSDF